MGRYSCLFYHCAQTGGSLPGKQSPAHSVAFCSISELGETKAACWLHSKPTGTGCFLPVKGGVHTFNQEQTKGGRPRHLTGLPEERHPARQVTPQCSRIKPELIPVLSGTFKALEKEHGLQIRNKPAPGMKSQLPACEHTHRQEPRGSSYSQTEAP